MINFIQLVLSFVSSLILFYIVCKNVYRGEYLSCINIFAIFTIADVLFPAMIGSLSGEYLKFYYFEHIDTTDYFIATIMFLFAILLFVFGWLVKKNIRFSFSRNKCKKAFAISESALLLFFLLSVLISVLSLVYEYMACGSWEIFYSYKITRAYLVTIDYDSLLKRMVQLASEFNVPILFIVTSIGIVNVDNLKHKSLWSKLVPLVTLTISISTLYRGTILSFFVMLIISLQFKSDKNLTLWLDKIRNKKKIYRMAIFAVVGFIFYGAVRSVLSAERWDIQLSWGEAVLKTISQTFGTTLSAGARCIDYWLDNNPLFFGRSIYEMFYFFIPRTIWTNKPTHYGIVSITTAMGSPSTTMDAVSIPGELIVNFGMLGMLLIPVIGFVFRCFESLKNHPRYKYIYAATVSTLVTTTMWMSFTGFFSKIKYFPIYMIVVMIIVRKHKIEK